MSMRRHLTVLLAVAAALAAARAARAAGPQEQVRQTTQKLLAVVADPALEAADKAAERRAKLNEVANERFNWPDMMARAMGRHWRARTPDERKELIALFTEIIRRTYTGKIEAYSGEEIRYTAEKIEGAFASVSCEVITKKNQAVPLEYRLKLQGDQWLVYDIAIEGVRLVNNYRSQFNTMLTQMPYSKFLAKLKEKVAAIKGE